MAPRVHVVPDGDRFVGEERDGVEKRPAEHVAIVTEGGGLACEEKSGLYTYCDSVASMVLSMRRPLVGEM